MTPERQDTINRILDLRQPDLTVITESIIKERNLAAIVRTCDAVGVSKVHCVEPPEGYRYYRGTSASADKYVDIDLYEESITPIKQLKASGFQIVAAHLSTNAVDYRDIDFTKPTALLMGTERSGVSEGAERQCDANIMIPMMGMVESFNVSVACAIILSEAQRQRQIAGFYSRPRLSSEARKLLFFKWAYPKLTDYCNKRGLAYPPLDDNGDLIAGTAPTWEVKGTEKL